MFQLTSSQGRKCKIDSYLLQLGPSAMRLSGTSLYHVHFTGAEGAGPAALGLQQPADGAGPAHVLPAGEHQRLEQPTQPQPPAHLLQHGTTVDITVSLYLTLYIIVKIAGHSVKPEGISFYYVSLMRLDEDLTYYNQSSYKFPSIFTAKLTYYANPEISPPSISVSRIII